MSTMTTSESTTAPVPTRAALELYRTRHGLSNSAVARQLGVHAGTISRYLAGKYPGDVPKLEASIEDLLKSAEERRDHQARLFETSVTRTVRNYINTVRRTNDIGLIHGPAGVGKSAAIQLYCAEYPTSISVTLNATTRTGQRLEASLFEAIETRGWKGNVSRWSFLVRRLRNSSRVICLDNAQRLDGDGRQWLFDFADETNCPIILVANPEILDRIRGNDQQFSRIGMAQAVSLRDDEIPGLARAVAEQFTADAEPIADLAAVVASHRGHLRAVRKQVLLMETLREAGGRLADPRTAFRAAHTKLIRDHALPRD